MSRLGSISAVVVPPSPAFQAEAVRQLYLIHGSGLAIVPLLGGAFVWGLWGHVDNIALLTWFGAWLVTTPLWPYLLIRRYRAQRPAPEEAARWGRYMSLMAAAEGSLWGIAGIFFYVPDSLPQQLLLLAFLIGKPAGSLFATSWWPTTFYANSVSSLVLSSGGMLYRGSSEQIAIGLGLLVYLAGMIQVTRMAHASAMETIALRFENTDLVEQLRREKELAEQANHGKSRFLAAASHDLRQPLHAMVLFIAALEEKIGELEAKNLVGSIRHCATALESLLQTLLDISKIDAGIVVPERVDFKLIPLVERLRDEYALQARAAGLILGVQCGDLTVHSDPALVEPILRNLLSNAIRYTQAGSVEILCTPTRAGVEIAVRDTGIGIPAEQHGRVFEEFVQLANPERDRTKGLGLGLAIVRRLAALIDTQVSLESEAGRGSVFRFVLPVGDPAAAAGASLPVIQKSLIEESVIVVVDDEAEVRAGMQALLEGWGCRVVVADSAGDAIDRLQKDNLLPEIVVADYRLREGKTGVDAIRSIAAHFGMAIPGAIITGDTAPERLGEAKASGYALLHKPVAPGKLRALLQNLKRGQGKGAGS